jgi:hypothetical protein
MNDPKDIFPNYSEDDLSQMRKTNHRRAQEVESDGQLAFFKPITPVVDYDQDSPAPAPRIVNKYPQLGQQANRLNQQRFNQGRTHSFSPIESISMDEMYIYSAQIDVVSQELFGLVETMPKKFEKFIFDYSKFEGNIDDFSKAIEEEEEDKSIATPSSVDAEVNPDAAAFMAKTNAIANEQAQAQAKLQSEQEKTLIDAAAEEDPAEKDVKYFTKVIKDLKQLCDRATILEKDLYNILDRIDNQGLRFKSIEVDQLKQLLEDTKVTLSKMPNMSVIQNSPLLISEYEQLEGRINALSKEILRRMIYDKASSTHHAIRPLRSLKSAIYYINRFIGYEEPRKYLHKAVRMLSRLRELGNFIINPEHNLNDGQIQQVLEVIKQGSHEWDQEFLANASSVWDFGPFDIKKIPLMIVAPVHSENYGAEEEISLSVIPDYLIHQVRILLNNLGLRKKPHFFQHQRNRFDDQ